MTASDALIEEAEKNAQALIDDARAQIARAIEAAREEGEREGAEQAQHMREEIAGLEARMLKEVEGEVVRAAMRVAGELLAAEMHLREDAVVDVACAALQTAKTAREINMRANPRDAPVLREHKQRLVAVLTRAKDLEVREDRRVAPGGVLVETENGVVDAQLDTQLEEIERVLTIAMAAHAGAPDQQADSGGLGDAAEES